MFKSFFHSINCATGPARRGWTLGLSLAGLAALAALGSAAAPVAAPADPDASATAPELSSVKVSACKDGDVTRFFVENKELCEVTMTFEMRLKNLKSSVPMPYTATFAPGKTEAFEISPAQPGCGWEYDYTNFFKLGSSCAQHDDSVIYELPYAPGGKFKVTQGYNGKFSHKGSNQYATDWQMPEGTLVCAARAGVVVKVKDSSDKGGGSLAYDRYNNFVLIRHDDGTLGHYCHLQKGGCLVKAGQRVATGDAIAHSGNTGFSSGPHLHFSVFKTRNGRERISLPVRFKTEGEKVVTLAAGRSYRAPVTHTASLPAASKTAAPAQGGGAAVQ
jgi:murein DD-endopeptidase MepM/ murein hydrolase activator NlpD